MGALKALVIGMAGLIVIGLVVIVVTIAKRLSGSKHGEPFAAALALPAGCSVAEMSAAGDRLALRLMGQGDCRVIILVDPATGVEAGRIRLDQGQIQGQVQ